MIDAHIVEVTFAVPITDELMRQVLPETHWLRLNDKVVVMLKNNWLADRASLQPHTAKDINYD